MLWGTLASFVGDWTSRFEKLLQFWRSDSCLRINPAPGWLTTFTEMQWRNKINAVWFYSCRKYFMFGHGGDIGVSAAQRRVTFLTSQPKYHSGTVFIIDQRADLQLRKRTYPPLHWRCFLSRAFVDTSWFHVHTLHLLMHPGKKNILGVWNHQRQTINWSCDWCVAVKCVAPSHRCSTTLPYLIPHVAWSPVDKLARLIGMRSKVVCHGRNLNRCDLRPEHRCGKHMHIKYWSYCSV